MSKFFSCLFFLVASIVVSFCVIFSLPISSHSQEKKEKKSDPWELKTVEVKIDAVHNPAVELTRKFVKSPKGKKFLDWTQGLNNTQIERKDYPPYSDKMIKVFLSVVAEKMRKHIKHADKKINIDRNYLFNVMKKDAPEGKKSVLYFMLNYYLSLARQKDADDVDTVNDELDHRELVIHGMVGTLLLFISETEGKEMMDVLDQIKKGLEQEFFQKERR